MCRRPGGAPCRCDTFEISAEAAAILLSFAMRESEGPAVELGHTLEHIGRGIEPRPAAPVGEDLARDLATCVRALQFHDRLMQQLAVVRNLLSTLSGHPVPETAGVGARRWEELLAELRSRLAADSRHDAFELLLRSGEVAAATGTFAVAAESSVELF